MRLSPASHYTITGAGRREGGGGREGGGEKRYTDKTSRKDEKRGRMDRGRREDRVTVFTSSHVTSLWE